MSYFDENQTGVDVRCSIQVALAQHQQWTVRVLAVVVSAVVSVLLLVGPASAEEPVGQRPPESETVADEEVVIVEVEEVQTDLTGRVVGTDRQTLVLEDQPTAELDGVARQSSLPPWQSGGTSRASGCTDINVTYTRPSNFGQSAPYYVYRQSKRWCFNRANQSTNSHTDSGDFARHDSLWFPRNQGTRFAYRFEWISGAAHSGHHSRYQGRIENCISQIGCFANESPTVEIRSHSNGTFRFRGYR